MLYSSCTTCSHKCSSGTTLDFRFLTTNAAHLHEPLRLVESVRRWVGGDHVQVHGPYGLLLPGEPDAPPQQRAPYPLWAGDGEKRDSTDRDSLEQNAQAKPRAGTDETTEQYKPSRERLTNHHVRFVKLHFFHTGRGASGPALRQATTGPCQPIVQPIPTLPTAYLHGSVKQQRLLATARTDGARPYVRYPGRAPTCKSYC